MVELAVFGNLFSEIVKHGIGKFKTSEEAKNLRQCVLDRIRRELDFNREIISELNRENETDDPRWMGEQRRRLIEALRTTAFDSIENQSIPLDIFFSDEIVEENHNVLFGVTESSHPTYYGYVKKINSQITLIENAYRRIHFCKLYGCDGGRVPNLNYLEYLTSSAIRSLDGSIKN